VDATVERSDTIRAMIDTAGLSVVSQVRPKEIGADEALREEQLHLSDPADSCYFWFGRLS
jgi:hypothetical protein